MKALTLWRPWPVAIFYLTPEYQKDVENRSWKPPDSIIGQRIAIHAGARCVDVFSHWLDIIKPSYIETLYLLAEWRELSEIRGIIGTVVIDGYCRSSESKSPWADDSGYCWQLRDPIALQKPIPCKGSQGLWSMPDEIEKRIKEVENG